MLLDKAEQETNGRAARDPEVEALLKGAIDLHCHSGPAAMPRVLDHREAMQEAADAGFRALLYKDHFYLGTPHARILEAIYPDTGVQLFSGIALNNASGGINPYAVDHAIKIGGKIVWMPTLAAANHIRKGLTEAKSFPKTAQKMLDPTPLSALDANGEVTDDAKKVLDLIAEGDIILASGHLEASELFILFEEARKRGVRKMLVNHPTYIVGCSDEDIRGLVSLGAYMEHSICMFIEGSGNQYEPNYLQHLIEVAGIDRTCLCSDLGLLGAPRPLEGYRQIVRALLDMQFSHQDIRTLIGGNSARLLNLAA
ncbi:DUF6282 family protein [Neorhizobium vignae]|uniref:DUF6282 family protein n=1 Tax=Neorhizobium vignae TaxID=690585 RepID=UPI000562529A|nr:DUF6282 family protein [Neorhizobium vignae]